MSTEPNSGDGILADQGSQEFGSVIADGFSSGGGGKPAGADAPAAPTPAAPVQETTPVAPAQQTQQVQQPAPVAPAPVQQPDIAAIIKSTVDATSNAMRPQPVAQAPKELSPQEFDRKYGIIRPTPEIMARILDQDPVKAAASLDHLLQSNLTASMRLANDVMEAKLAQMQEKFEPTVKSWQAHQVAAANQAAENAFYAEHADLANEREVVNEIKDAYIAKVQSGQIKFNNQKEANAAVAQATRSILQKVRGGQPAPQGQGQTPAPVAGNARPTNHSSGRQMSAASSAGRTGTGQASAKPKDIVDEVFGSDAM